MQDLSLDVVPVACPSVANGPSSQHGGSEQHGLQAMGEEMISAVKSSNAAA